MVQNQNEVIRQANDDSTWQTPNNLMDPIQNHLDQKPKNSSTYYVVTTLYCIFLVITGLFITFTPQSWLSEPKCAMIMNAMATRMPGLVYLASLSDSPQVIIFGYGLAFMTMPIHLIVLSIIAVSRFNNGFITRRFIIDQLKWYWILLLITWSFFFTCFFCDDEPNWRFYMMVSSRAFIAFIAQCWVGLSSFLPGIFLIIILDNIQNRRRQQHQVEEDDGH